MGRRVEKQRAIDMFGFVAVREGRATTDSAQMAVFKIIQHHAGDAISSTQSAQSKPRQ
jgi:hypothetical protein